MAPPANIPRVKIITRNIVSPISKCGDNWYRDIRIRCPHDNVDIAFRTLPALGSPAQINEFDQELASDIISDINRITFFIKKYSNQLNSSQLKNIELMLGRAKLYSDDAAKIMTAWETGFSTKSGKIPPWPLGGDPLTLVTDSVIEGHSRDSSRWKSLMISALKNARCSEEVAKRATIKKRNIELSGTGRVFGLGGISEKLPKFELIDNIKKFSLPSQGLDTGTAKDGDQNVQNIIVQDPSEPETDLESEYPDLESGEIILEDDQDNSSDDKSSGDQKQKSEAIKRSPKKGNSALLAAGAIAFSALALSRR